MSYLPKATVENNVRKRVRRDKAGRERVGFEAYFGTDPFTKKAVRMTRASEDELKRDIKTFYQRHQAGGDAAVRLSPTEAIDARAALDALREAGSGASLQEAVRGFLEGGQKRTAEGGGVSAAEAFEAYITQKYGGFPRRLPNGRRAPGDYNPDRDKAIATAGKWVRSLGDARLADVSAKGVADYLAENYGARRPKTYNSHLMYIRTFLNWCCRDERRLLDGNPARGLRGREVPWEEPRYMRAADAERLFRLLEGAKAERPELLAFAVASFFWGCRTVEILRLAELGDGAVRVCMEDETVRIAKGKGFQRGKMPRAFHVGGTAMAWMRSFDFAAAAARITGRTQGEVFGAARAAGVPVFKNCGRHTFITYHVAAFGDPAKTQAIVGTSARMRAENYCGLASRAEAEEFFRILPGGGGDGKDEKYEQNA